MKAIIDGNAVNLHYEGDGEWLAECGNITIEYQPAKYELRRYVGKDDFFCPCCNSKTTLTELPSIIYCCGKFFLASTVGFIYRPDIKEGSKC